MSGSVAPKQYTMKPQGKEKNILRSMNQQRKENGQENCEVVLITNGIKHYAHKIVLSSCSDFFREYFENKEKTSEETSFTNMKNAGDKSKSLNEKRKQTIIQLPGINSEELGPILEYMYTSKLALRAENVNEILLVGCLLQITSVIEFCADVLIKQPGWRSPLVSKQICNFTKAKDDKGNRSEHQFDVRSRLYGSHTFTDVTWASDGTRTATLEPQVTKRKAQKQSGTTPEYKSVKLTEGVNHRHVQNCVENSHNSQKASVTIQRRKRQYPNSMDAMNKSRKQETKRSFVQNAESTMKSDSISAFDAEELKKELLLSRLISNPLSIDIENSRNQIADRGIYQNRKYTKPKSSWFSSSLNSKSMFQTKCNQKESNNAVKFMGHPSPDVLQKGTPIMHSPIRSKYSNSIDAFTNYSALSNSQLLAKENPISHSHHSVDTLSQASGVNQNLAAAYASAWGLPIIQPAYFGYHFLNSIGGIEYLNATDLSKNVMLLNNQMAHSYDSSQFRRSQFYSKRDDFAEAMYSSPYADKRFGPSLNLGPSLTPDFYQVQKSVAASNVGRSQMAHIVANQTLATPLNLACNTTKNRSLKDSQLDRSIDKKDLKRHDETPKTGKQDSESPAGHQEEGVERVSATCMSSMTANKNMSTHDKNTYIDYNTRKRKLLRAAQSFVCDNQDSDDSKLNFRRYKKIRDKVDTLPFVKQSQCSSEDDIITRECHQIDVSDPESDDSGRPSSV